MAKSDSHQSEMDFAGVANGFRRSQIWILQELEMDFAGVNVE